MSELKIKFGKKLRRIRRMRDLSQEQLAEKASMSADFISTLERGLSNASFETLQKLAEVLEVEVSELFTPIEEK
jgi:transcriptional regulator with XRE-family HTH domain